MMVVKPIDSIFLYLFPMPSSFFAFEASSFPPEGRARRGALHEGPLFPARCLGQPLFFRADFVLDFQVARLVAVAGIMPGTAFYTCPVKPVHHMLYSLFSAR